MVRIAVENSLGNVKELLQNKGYEVVSLEGDQIPDCQCCVVSGQDDNVMGIQNVAVEVPVLTAEGMTAEQLLSEIDERVNIAQDKQKPTM